MSTPEFQKVEQKMAPKLAAFEDRITQNTQLFARIEAVYKGPEYKTLTPEQQRLTWESWNNFVRAGARLDEPKQGAAVAKSTSASPRCSPRSRTTCSRTRRATSPGSTRISSAGCRRRSWRPRPLRRRSAGAKSAYAITNTRSSMEPFLTYSTDRKLREKVWRTYYNRGDNGDKHDNNAIITGDSQAARRAREAAGLSHARALAARGCHGAHARKRHEAHGSGVAGRHRARARRKWRTCRPSRTAKLPRAAGRSSSSRGTTATTRKKCARRKYKLDADEVRQYLQLDKLREGMFWVAGSCSISAFTPITGVPVYHPDMTRLAR